MRVQGREKWVMAKWRGVEKCSVGTVREWGVLWGGWFVAGGGIESGEGGNLEGGGVRGTGDVSYAEGRHGGYYKVRVKEEARELIEFALMACSPVATGEGENVMGGRNLAGLGFRPFRSALYLTSECSSSLSYSSTYFTFHRVSAVMYFFEELERVS